MLFQRYANPYPMLNTMLAAQRLSFFIDEFLKISNEECNEKKLWEFYLHKVIDKNYTEFKESLIAPAEKKPPATKDELTEIVKRTLHIHEIQTQRAV